MTSRRLAWLTVVSVLTLVLTGIHGWNSWRRHVADEIPIGAGKDEVLRRLGEPDPGAAWAALGSCSGTECWTYKLIGEDYIAVCFDRAGKVVCHESFSVWT